MYGVAAPFSPLSIRFRVATESPDNFLKVRAFTVLSAPGAATAVVAGASHAKRRRSDFAKATKSLDF